MRPARSRPQWLFLRALGLIFVTAFASLWTQINGLIGPRGILPVREYLDAVAAGRPGMTKLWAAPSLLWIDSSSRALSLLCFVGLVAGLALVFNLLPRAAVLVATICYLSFVSVAQEFSQYQSDGMLLEAGLLTFFLLGSDAPLFAEQPSRPRWLNQLLAMSPMRAALWMLRWEWFRLYFESGFVKWFGGDPQWHALTALDRYYENGPLPTWLAWYAQQELPHAFHAACAAFTLIIELFAPLVLFLPWRSRLARHVRHGALILCAALQLGILATANYAFINHLALTLGILMFDFSDTREEPSAVQTTLFAKFRNGASIFVLAMMFWTTLLLFPGFPLSKLPTFALAPAQLLQPLRVANRFGLFGRMTEARYELEFQGSTDGIHWTAYPFRRKPQDIHAAPGFYAPHQPRFDWNLWFASLGDWQEAEWTLRVCEGILRGKQPILSLFAADPFAGRPPSRCRIDRYQYWFTTPAEKAATGDDWRREEKGVWAPVMKLQEGRIELVPEDE